MRTWAEFSRQGYLKETLTKEKPIIAIMGCYQIGKSTLLNCFLNDYAALTGKGMATTSLTARYRHGMERSVAYRSREGTLVATDLEQLHNGEVLCDVAEYCSFHIEVKCSHPLLEECDIVDTPGINANDDDTSKAMQALMDVHYVLFVIPNRMFTQVEKAMLLSLLRRRISFSVIMNCVNGRREEQWIPRHPINQRIREENEEWLRNHACDCLIPIHGQLVYTINGLFYWSQQRAFADSCAYIDRPDTVHKHIEGLFKEEGIDCTRLSIIRESCIEELINHLCELIHRYDPFTHGWRQSE